MRQRIVILILLIVAVVLFFWQPSLDWKIQRRIYQFRTPKAEDLTQDLLLELNSLKTKSSVWTYLDEQLATSTIKSIVAPVYAKYPFNNRGEVAIAAGTDNGVAVAEPVLAAFGSKDTPDRGVLIGIVTQVSHNMAIVRTLYDQKFQLSVKVGSKSANALFTGGLEPKVGFISKDAEFKEGDSVWNADPSAPYGASLGMVKNIGLSADRASQEASVVLPYELSDLRVVRVITNHDAIQPNKL